VTLDGHVALAARHPHDFTVQYPPRREYARDHFCVPAEGGRVLNALAGAPRLLLYVHVPFCEARCSYCNFAVDTHGTPERQVRYVRALVTALGRLAGAVQPGVEVPGIDLGGGTPTLLAPPLLEQLLEALRPWAARSRCPWPVSIETTPAVAAAEPEKMRRLAEGGVQRISVGVQSTRGAVLEAVRRGAQVDRSERALAVLRRAGFRRVNADLIFGLPGQRPVDFAEDVARVADAGVDSVTTYDCLYRGKGRALTRATAELPTPADYARLYDAAYGALTARGFHAPYGSLNFSRHAGETGTSPYFEGRLLDGLPYVGVGNYASTLCGGHWGFAPYAADSWMAQVEGGAVLPLADLYALPVQERVAKQVLLSLSFGRLDPARFRAAHGVGLEEACGPAVRRALEEGWLVEAGGEYRVAPGRFDVLPQLRALFYPPGAVRWLEAHGPSLRPLTSAGRARPPPASPR
jgi:oxygen-independent coproporphyrinogen-3 oxidase